MTSFRPFPAASLAATLGGARAVAVVERTDEPPAADNPLTREIEGRPLRSRARRARWSRASSRSRPGSARATSIAARPRRRLRLAGRATASGRADATPSSASATRSRSSAAAARPPPAGAFSAARPLDRRLRLGHDQQAARDAGGRALRQARPGLSALRVGEEGPADDLLPDHRRRRRSASTASSTRSTSCRSTTSRPSR